MADRYPLPQATPIMQSSSKEGVRQLKSMLCTTNNNSNREFLFLEEGERTQGHGQMEKKVRNNSMETDGQKKKQDCPQVHIQLNAKDL